MKTKLTDKLIAKIILAVTDDVQLISPYDLEDIGDLISTHSRTSKFFFEDEKPINCADKAKEILGRS